MSTTFEKSQLQSALVELIRRASCDLPGDVEAALGRAYRREAKGSGAKAALKAVLLNVSMAREGSTPVCQDTGTNLYFVQAPITVPESLVTQSILGATRRASWASGWGGID